jgi:hypothetical protein
MKLQLGRLEVKWGIIFSLMTIFWMILEKMLGWHDELIEHHETMTNFVAIPAILLYVLALIEKRKSLGGLMSWKEGFFSGLGISVIVALLAPLVQLLVYYVISPEYFQTVIEFAVSEQGKNREEMEAYFNIKSYLWQSAVGAIFMGAMTSAVVALFVKKKA